MTLAIRSLDTTDAGFRAAFVSLLDRAQQLDAKVEAVVREVIGAVRARGDDALLDYTTRFDRWTPASVAALEIPKSLLAQAAEKIPNDQRAALEQAAARVRRYHDRQKIDSWSYTEADGTLLGQQVTALDRVGLYVPGGKAAYPSSVLMNAIPAKVAGVSELIMVVPTPEGQLNDLVLAAAHIAGVDRVFRGGGGA